MTAPATVYVHPGQVAAAAGPVRLTALVGSSVALCLHDTEEAVAGMCHFVLPGASGGSARGAAAALDALLRALARLGARPPHLRAKLVGGTCPVGVYTGEAPLGLRNVRAARALLARHCVPLVAEDVGETYARKLQFETTGGCLSVQPLRPFAPTAP